MDEDKIIGQEVRVTWFVTRRKYWIHDITPQSRQVSRSLSECEIVTGDVFFLV
jgi:hypothetical protein